MIAKSNPVILIGMVCGDMVHADYANSLAQLFGHALTHGIGCGITFVKSTLIDMGRNIAVEQFLQSQATHLLFIDSDMSFQADAAMKLLKHDLDVVGVTYSRRRPPFELVHENRAGSKHIIQDMPYEVKYLGFGMVLIKRKVIEAMKYPYFMTGYINDDENPTRPKLLGEDQYFCDTARGLGFGVCLDGELSRNVRHCGLHYYSVEDAENWAKTHENVSYKKY